MFLLNVLNWSQVRCSAIKIFLELTQFVTDTKGFVDCKHSLLGDGLEFTPNIKTSFLKQWHQQETGGNGPVKVVPSW